MSIFCQQKVKKHIIIFKNESQSHGNKEGKSEEELNIMRWWKNHIAESIQLFLCKAAPVLLPLANVGTLKTAQCVPDGFLQS